MRAIRGWLGHMGSWAIASLLLSLTPFAATLLGLWIVQGSWPGLQPAIGMGQLLPTCVALMANNLHGFAAKSEAKETQKNTSGQTFTISLIVITAFIYGFLTCFRIISGNLTPQVEDNVVNASILALAVSIITGAIPAAVRYKEGKVNA